MPTALTLARSAKAMLNKHSRRTGGLSIISRTAGDFGAGTIATVSGTIVTTIRIRHINLTGEAVVSAAPVFAAYGPAGSPATEAAPATDWQVKFAIEPAGTATDQTTTQRGMNRGQHLWNLERRCVARADETQFYVAAGGMFYERTGVTTVSGNGTVNRHQIARGGTAGFGADTGEGGDASDKVLTNNTTANTTAGFSACLMVGRTISGKITPSITVVGDSKGVGNHDGEFGANAGGWPSRACAAFPGGNVSMAGERLSSAVLSVNFSARFELCRYATHILCEYLTNDIIAGDSVATMKANVLAFALRFMRRGQNFIMATTPPLTDSTDGWKTVTNQTPRTNESNRTAMNDWIRDTSSTGFVAQAVAQVAAIPDCGWADFIDPCLGIEVNASNVLTTNGGRIKASTTVIDTGTASAATTGSITDSSKTFTVNALKGKVVHTTGGTGSGQNATIMYNTATVMTTTPAFAVTPDATTTYEIIDGNSIDGTHESTSGHILEAAAVQAKVNLLMARL